ncbi:hypothetical protein CBOM_01933 [Ceraceosorus bombacis]|uniref:Uncharacterized protein n=1 Tax=Ceraceosorus bombacis TaxID=401625 RepID=A0A0P1BE08_9BASI|nr:hypothetical protein CBOM_01933 [Ceraceosorus bombacis]
MRTSTLQTLSMLEALGVEQVDLFTHSGGWLYMLDLLRTRPELIIPSPSGRASNLTLCSPFVPTHLSSSSLGLLPASLVRMTPSAANLLGSCEKAISWSAGVGQNVKSMWGSKETPERLHASKRDQLKRAAREREKSKRTHPNATFHPPYTTHLHLELDAAVVAEHSLAGGSSRKPQSGSKLLFECYKAESGIETTTQEFLFCLGKTSGMNNAELETWLSANLRELARLLRSRTKRCSDTPDGGAPTAAPRLLLVWADQDFMTPQRGRDHLDDLLQRTGLAEACSSTHRWIAAGAGHDDPPGSLDIMRGVFAFSKGESEILALRAAQTSAQAECFAAHKGAPDERSACAS